MSEELSAKLKELPEAIPQVNNAGNAVDLWFVITTDRGFIRYSEQPNFNKEVVIRNQVTEFLNWTGIGRNVTAQIQNMSFEKIGLHCLSSTSFREKVLPELVFVGRDCKELSITGGMNLQDLADALQATNPNKIIFCDRYFDDEDPVFKDVPTVAVRTDILSKSKYRNCEKLVSMMKTRTEVQLLLNGKIPINTVKDFLKVWQNGADIGSAKQLSFFMETCQIMDKLTPNDQKKIIEGFNYKRASLHYNALAVTIERPSSEGHNTAVITIWESKVLITFKDE